MPLSRCRGLVAAVRFPWAPGARHYTSIIELSVSTAEPRGAQTSDRWPGKTLLPVSLLPRPNAKFPNRCLRNPGAAQPAGQFVQVRDSDGVWQFLFRSAEPPNRHVTCQLLPPPLRIFPSAHASPASWQTGGLRRRSANSGQTIRGLPETSRPARAPAPHRNRPRGICHPAARAGIGMAAPSWLQTRGNPARFSPYHEIISSKPRRRSTTSSACVIARRSSPTTRSNAPGSQTAPAARSVPRTRLLYIAPPAQRLKRGQAHDEIANRTRSDQESLRHKC